MAKLSAADVQGRDCDDYLRQHLEELRHIEISLSDIQELDTFKEMMSKSKKGYNDKELLFKFLYILGMDTSKNIEVQECTHRNKANKVVECTRWVGYSRTDKEWLSMKKRG